jgi:hypothetical protein
MLLAIQVEVNRFRDIQGRFASLSSPAAADHMFEHVNAAGLILQRGLQQEAPRGQPDPLGRPRKYPPLADNIRFQVHRSSRGFWVRYSAPPQAKWVIRGTPPHPIVGRRCPLYFYWDRVGRPAYFWSVQHPGTAPNRFDQRAVARVRSDVEREIRRGAYVTVMRIVAGTGNV